MLPSSRFIHSSQNSRVSERQFFVGSAFGRQLISSLFSGPSKPGQSASDTPSSFRVVSHCITPALTSAPAVAAPTSFSEDPSIVAARALGLGILMEQDELPGTPSGPAGSSGRDEASAAAAQVCYPKGGPRCVKLHTILGFSIV